MAKRIVICFDGTWNVPDEPFVGLSGLHRWYRKLRGMTRAEMQQSLAAEDPAAEAVETNVCRFFRSIVDRPPGSGAPGTTAQIRWYDAGVGTRWFERVRGGAFGLGLSVNLREGYHALAQHYEPGDAIYIIGFSRGAYTARSLVGLIRNVGLLPAEVVADGAHGRRMMEAYEIYRTRDGSADSERALTFRARHGSRDVAIDFLGVWDTVGALGLPLRSFRDFNLDLYRFHDTELSGIVRNAFHAVAVDEHRADYAATLWDPVPKPGQHVEQHWFVGAHADVGGGYDDRMLSDIALAWMQDRARQVGLELRDTAIPAVTPGHAEGVLHDSFANFLKGTYQFVNDRYFRPIPPPPAGVEVVHGTVQARRRLRADYRPRNAGLPPA